MSILLLLLSFSFILGTTHAIVPIDCPDGTDPSLCIKVGFTTSQTGAQAYEGQLHGNGTIMWADDVNKNGGLKTIAKGNDKSVFIKLIYYDDTSNAATCTQLYKNLINEDKVDVLLGPYGTSLTQAARNVAHNNSKLLIAGSAAADSTYSINYPLFFGIVTTGSKYMAPLLTSLYAKSARTAVILRSDADFASSVAEGAIASLGTLGYQILGVREFKRADASAATLAPIVAALASYNADVFIAAILLENGEEVLAGILATKYRPKALIMQSAGASTAFIADQGDRANHILAPSQWEITTQFTGSFYTDTKDYERKFSTRFNTSTFPSYISAEATAAGIILGHALSNATNHTATELAAWLDGLQVPIPTFFGPVKFDETGRNIQKQMVGTQIQNGKIVQVTGAGAQAELVYPMKWLVPANDASRLSISIPYIVIASLLFALWM